MRLSRWAALALLAALWTGCAVEIQHGLAEEEATRIVAILHEHGIVEAEKHLDDEEENLWRIHVPKSASGRAFTILKDYKLPRAPERRFHEVYGKSKLVTTPKEEEMLALETLQGEISHTIEGIEGVIDARVHLVLPERDLSNRPLGPSKASVLVVYQPTSQGLSPVQNAELQKLVGYSVDHLEAENVAVVQKPGSIASPAVAGAPDVHLVDVASLLIDSGSVGRLKALIIFVVLVIAGLGWVVFWQSRVLGELRQQLTAERTGLVPARSRPAARPPSKPAPGAGGPKPAGGTDRA